jgi:CO dehydrogenase maturation factor
MTRMRARGDIVVVGGKGGVGKTSISAILVKLLRGTKLLVIDADPVISLTHVLGATADDTLGGLREEMIENPRRARNLHERPIRQIIAELVRPCGDGYDLLTMGRAEAGGCFCGVNELLRHGVETLCADYDLTLIDSEAGIEQINRRAVHRIDRLVVVTDTSRRGFETVLQVRDLALKYNNGKPLTSHVVVNRVRNDDERARMDVLARSYGLDATVCIPEDPLLRDANIDGRSLLALDDASPAVATLRALAETLLSSASRERGGSHDV